MHSSVPKVLLEIGGSPLLFHILRQVKQALPKSKVGVVVGHRREQVIDHVRSSPEFSSMDLEFLVQEEPRGTGDAARVAMQTPWGEALVKGKSGILILPGDLPLLSPDLISQMTEPLSRSAALRLLTSELPDPTGYGRIVRKGKNGKVLRIVEEKDANPREKLIQEVGASIYFFQGSFLKNGLQLLSNKNAQHEYYLTDLIAQASRAKKEVEVLKWKDPQELRGVNDPWELTLAGRFLNERCVKQWALKGVRFLDAVSTRVDPLVQLAPDVEIEPGVLLQGATQVGEGARIGSGAKLRNVVVGAGANVKTGTVAEDSTIGEGAQVGPYAHLRPGSRIGARAKIGNFVEIKEASIGEGTSVAHLSYIGDAEIGSKVNIGCGFVTCNFDGRVIDGKRKHRTVIEDGAFIGSDCQTIAPIRVGKGAYVASGSTVSENVEAGALAIARARQVNKPGYAAKLRGEPSERE